MSPEDAKRLVEKQNGDIAIFFALMGPIGWIIGYVYKDQIRNGLAKIYERFPYGSSNKS